MALTPEETARIDAQTEHILRTLMENPVESQRMTRKQAMAHYSSLIKKFFERTPVTTETTNGA